MPVAKEVKTPLVKSVSIEYLPSEDELDLNKPLVIGQGLMGRINISEELGYKEYFGTRRYITGLDEDLVSWDSSLTDDEKKSKIKEIRETLARLEKVFGAGTLNPTNEQHWSKIRLYINKKTTNLDLSDPKNEIIFHCIKAGGFNTVASSLEDAQRDLKRFYLIEPIEFIENRVANTRLVSKAISALEDIDVNKGYDEMFYLAKYILPVERAYTKTTPQALFFEELYKFINNEIIKKDRKYQNASIFLDVLKLAKDYRKATVLIKDGLFYDFIYANEAGDYKNSETGGTYGNNIEKAAKHILNPAYVNELENIQERVNKKWGE